MNTKLYLVVGESELTRKEDAYALDAILRGVRIGGEITLTITYNNKFIVRLKEILPHRAAQMIFDELMQHCERVSMGAAE